MVSDPKDQSDDERKSEFTETGAFLNDAALAAFAVGMNNTEPTEALKKTMARAKIIRQA